MEFLLKIIDHVLKGLLSKWQERRQRKKEFERFRRRVLCVRITNNLPIELNNLRSFLIDTGLIEKLGFKEFYDR